MISRTHRHWVWVRWPLCRCGNSIHITSHTLRSAPPRACTTTARVPESWGGAASRGWMSAWRVQGPRLGAKLTGVGLGSEERARVNLGTLWGLGSADPTKGARGHSEGEG